MLMPFVISQLARDQLLRTVHAATADRNLSVVVYFCLLGLLLSLALLRLGSDPLAIAAAMGL